MTTTLSHQQEMTRAIGTKNDESRSRTRSQIYSSLITPVQPGLYGNLNLVVKGNMIKLHLPSVLPYTVHSTYSDTSQNIGSAGVGLGVA